MKSVTEVFLNLDILVFSKVETEPWAHSCWSLLSSE